MFKYVLLSLFIICTGCSDEDAVESKVLMGVNPDPPFTIQTDFQLFLGLEDGVPVYEPIVGPWSTIGFDFVNNHTEVVTLIAVTFQVLGPDNKTRTASTYNNNTNEADELILLSYIKPENDIDCDGIDENVYADDGTISSTTEGTAPAACEFDDKNLSFTGGRIFVSDLLEGVEAKDRDKYRNGIYQVTAKFEGWVGPIDNPKSNFIKEIFFTIESN